MAEGGVSIEGSQSGIVNYAEGDIMTQSLRKHAEDTIQEFKSSEDPQKREAYEIGNRITEEINTLRKQGVAPELLDQSLAAMIARSIYETKTAQEKASTAEDEAKKDALTGLYNGGKLKEDLAETLITAQDTSGLFVDLDNLSVLNGMHGHNAGDTLLKKFVEVVNGQIRDDDKFYRFKGDEFFVTLKNTPVEQAQDIATRVVTSLRDNLLPAVQNEGYLPGRTEPLLASIGIVHKSPGQHPSPDMFIEQGDRALFAAKKLGQEMGEKGKTMVYSDSLPKDPGYQRS